MKGKKIIISVLAILCIGFSIFTIIACKNHDVHEWDEGVITKEVTCSTNGEITYTCTECGEFKVETIISTGHTEVVDAAVAATCTTTGLTEGKHCSVCNEVLVAQEVVAAKGHTEVIDAAVAATCTTNGLTEGKHCSECGTTLVYQQTIVAKGHTEVVDAAVAATCTTNGLTEGKHCSECGTTLVYQQTIVAKGHTEVIDAAVAATCTTAGKTEGKHCSVCNEVLVAQEVVAAGHTEVIDAAVAATCTETGLTEGKHCSVCNEVLVAQEVVPCHNFENYVCSECGFHYYTEGLVFTLLNDEYSVTGYTGSDVDVVIPSIYNNKPVTSIGERAFDGCSSLTSLNIGNGVTSISYGSFLYCSSLISIEISDNVKSIGERAFEGCSSLTSIVIPESVTSIGESAFSNCSSLTSIVIPESVTSIGGSAFYYCKALKSIVIPESVTSIGESAFSNCKALTSIVIPESVTSIGSSAFSGCSSLIYNKYDNGLYLGNENNPYVLFVRAIDRNITTCEIHPNTTIIYEDAFYGCETLKYNKYDNGLYLGNENNPYMVLISTINKNITTCEIHPNTIIIYEDAFYGCQSLTSIVIPENVALIYSQAFKFCYALTSIRISESVTSIGNSAFYCCDELATVYYEGTEEQWNSITGDYWRYDLTNITIVFNSCLYHNYVDYVCSKCGSHYYTEGLVFTLSNNEYSVTGYNGSDVDVVIPAIYNNKPVTSIGSSAFSNCSSLTSITIPASVTSIRGNIFSSCNSLKSIVVETSNTVYDSRNNCNAIIYTATNTMVVGCNNTIIPNDVTCIGGAAFYGCSSLTSITIPDSVTIIQPQSFYGCDSLTTIYYTGTVEQWNDITIYSYNDNLKDVTIIYNYEEE